MTQAGANGAGGNPHSDPTRWREAFEQIREALLAGDEGSARIAVERLGRAARDETDPTGPLGALIDALFMMDRYDEAATACQRLLDCDAGHVRALEVLAQIHFFQGRYDEAVRYAERALKRDPLALLAGSVLRHAGKRRRHASDYQE